ncbi:MAG: GNAT family N-acetyltransferase [SAR324 cluster bacterium]|nr:GNAT family N-acetyltransferase [SAR324 cluster bacterium]
MEHIQYEINAFVSAEEFIKLLHASTLASRRPVDDQGCIESMLKHANLIVSARSGCQLVGIARSVTDFSYCCYLSDLAVDHSCQKQGIGKQLIYWTQKQLGPKCKIILLSAPGAVNYYPHIGFFKHEQAWILPPEVELK